MLITDKTNEETIRNIFALFSGMYYEFKTEPGDVERTAERLAHVPRAITLGCAQLTMFKLSHFRIPIIDDFCELVLDNDRLAKENQSNADNNHD